ncbi:MAG: hypothetical protein ABR507_12210 [Actinomycetota bacterium]|nr:hypothetical protein [Actinomycetota bacterium]
MSDQALKSSRMSYSQARNLLLAAGLGVLILLAVLAYIGQVDPDPVEIEGTLLFIPVFIAFVFWDVTGGVIGAILAAAAFAALRYNAAQVIGYQVFVVQVMSKWIFYLAFGVIGGWANKQMKTSLQKLELFDQIDDATGLFNARFFVQDSDLELSRSTRYQTIFSVVVVDVPVAALNRLARRQRVSTLKALGALLADSVRTVDRAVHGMSKDHHRLAVLLPETGREGGNVFSARLAAKVAEYLSNRGASISAADIKHQSLTLPEDQEALQRLRTEFAEIDRAEHPEEADSASHGTG